VIEAPSLAAVLATGEPERLYSGLSVLVSRTIEGERCIALATFRSLDLLLSWPMGGESRFDRSMTELIDVARSLKTLDIWACAASCDLLEIKVEPLDGVMSTPRFLREARGAELIFV
jgi:hypothetical protein